MDTGYLRYGWNHPSFKWYAFWSYIMPLFITILTFCMENFFNHYEVWAHHMFLRILKPRIYQTISQNFLCFVFLQGRSFRNRKKSHHNCSFFKTRHFVTFWFIDCCWFLLYFHVLLCILQRRNSSMNTILFWLLIILKDTLRLRIFIRWGPRKCRCLMLQRQKWIIPE